MHAGAAAVRHSGAIFLGCVSRALFLLQRRARRADHAPAILPVCGVPFRDLRLCLPGPAGADHPCILLQLSDADYTLPLACCHLPCETHSFFLDRSLAFEFVSRYTVNTLTPSVALGGLLPGRKVAPNNWDVLGRCCSKSVSVREAGNRSVLLPQDESNLWR